MSMVMVDEPLLRAIASLLERDTETESYARELRLAMQAGAVPEGYKPAPIYMGYAHLGLRQYEVHVSSPEVCTEICFVPVSVIERKAEKLEASGFNKKYIEPDNMAVRIRFESVEALNALEDQLELLRIIHFPLSQG